MEGNRCGGAHSQGPSPYTYPNLSRRALGEKAPPYNDDVHVRAHQATPAERQDSGYMSSSVPGARNVPGRTPQRDAATGTHYPALAYGGTITVSQAPPNAAQNAAWVVRRPGTASETLTREQAMNGKPPMALCSQRDISSAR